MAKSSKRSPRESHGATAQSTENRRTKAHADDALVDMAEDLGKLLGSAQNRMSSWLGERQEIATKLVQIRDTANAYLRELTAGGASLAAAIERGRRSADAAPTTDKNASSSTPRKPRSSSSGKSSPTKR